MELSAVPVFVLVACVVALALGMLAFVRLAGPRRAGGVKRMPYESGMDPVHDTRRRFDVRFHLLAVAFLVFDVELLFLYPWAVAYRSEAAVPTVDAPPTCTARITSSAGTQARPVSSAAPRPAFIGGLVFIALLALGFIYDWRKGVFQWR